MKKFTLLFVASLLLVSCSMDDDGVRTSYQNSEVASTNLPESFEKNKTYTVEVTYLLPTACHTAAGIDVKSGSGTGDDRRDIYVVGISSYDANQTACNREEDDLERKASFTIQIDEEEPYTFYLWEGYDAEEEENIFTVVEVPVI